MATGEVLVYCTTVACLCSMTAKCGKEGVRADERRCGWWRGARPRRQTETRRPEAKVGPARLQRLTHAEVEEDARWAVGDLVTRKGVVTP
ncbi:unnamed protein product [Linum trigynum]|uniref:Uncharacterized protein n=1 Tax=Linum trigynum TaxID=586398 RepID=A0AAV2GLF5_9ROSI